MQHGHTVLPLLLVFLEVAVGTGVFGKLEILLLSHAYLLSTRRVQENLNKQSVRDKEVNARVTCFNSFMDTLLSVRLGVHSSHSTAPQCQFSWSVTASRRPRLHRNSLEKKPFVV